MVYNEAKLQYDAFYTQFIENCINNLNNLPGHVHEIEDIILPHTPFKISLRTNKIFTQHDKNAIKERFPSLVNEMLEDIPLFNNGYNECVNIEGLGFTFSYE